MRAAQGQLMDAPLLRVGNQHTHAAHAQAAQTELPLPGRESTCCGTPATVSTCIRHLSATRMKPAATTTLCGRWKVPVTVPRRPDVELYSSTALQSALHLYSSTALYTLHPLHPPSGRCHCAQSENFVKTTQTRKFGARVM